MDIDNKKSQRICPILKRLDNLRVDRHKPEKYNQAVTALSGADAILTPLWWAKK